jgi:hypothetical protein
VPLRPYLQTACRRSLGRARLPPCYGPASSSPFQFCFPPPNSSTVPVGSNVEPSRRDSLCQTLVFAWQRHRNLAFRRPSMNCLALRVRVSSPRLNGTPACTMPTVTSSSKPHRNSESMPVLRCSVRERCRARTPRVSTAKATTPGQAVGVPGYATRTCLSPAAFVTPPPTMACFKITTLPLR